MCSIETLLESVVVASGGVFGVFVITPLLARILDTTALHFIVPALDSGIVVRNERLICLITKFN